MLEYIENDIDSDTCVALLHGYGANMYDLFDLYNFLPGAKVISYQAPLEIGPMAPGGRAWFSLDFTPGGIVYNEPEAFEAIETLSGVMKSLREKYSKLIILGFSQGAILAHGMLLQNPGLFDAAICLSGRFNENIFLDEYKENVKDLPIFISHGTFDQVIPIDSGRRIIEFYKDSEANAFAKEYIMSHEISQDCIIDMKNWFESL